MVKKATMVSTEDSFRLSQKQHGKERENAKYRGQFPVVGKQHCKERENAEGGLDEGLGETKESDVSKEAFFSSSLSLYLFLFVFLFLFVLFVLFLFWYKHWNHDRVG